MFLLAFFCSAILCSIVAPAHREKTLNATLPRAIDMESSGDVEQKFLNAQAAYDLAVQSAAELLVNYSDVYMDNGELVWGGGCARRLGGGAAWRRFLPPPLKGGGCLLRHAKWPTVVNRSLICPKFWLMAGLGGSHLWLLVLAWGPRGLDTS
jgi:hypothetical protein